MLLIAQVIIHILGASMILRNLDYNLITRLKDRSIY